MHLPVTAVQLACMASMALQRCEVLGPPPPASPSVSFLSFSPLPGRLFSILAALLDW